MINPKELRLGNWVFYYGKAIQLDEEYLEVLFGARNYQDYQPIELTPEILEKAGFEPYKYYSDTMSYKRDWFIWTKGWFQKGIKILNEDVKYLHQLQNLYFALTGEELTIDATLYSQATTEEK
jgi:hypothetical protein